MLTSLTYSNTDGTRTAIVERCDSGESLFLWSVTCRDHNQSDHCLTGYLHFCQRVARRWVQQGHPPAGAAPGGRAVSPAQGGQVTARERPRVVVAKPRAAPINAPASSWWLCDEQTFAATVAERFA